MTFKPDPVQVEAWKHGKEARKRGQRGFGYIVEQGLGKTALACGEILELAAENVIDRAVIVIPNSFKQGWVTEIQKQGFPINTFIFESGEHAAQAWWLRNSVKPNMVPVVLVNYEAIRNSTAQEFIEKFVAGHRAALYSDESINISTHDAAQTKAALLLSKLFVWRSVLSGKWMKQGPHDFWSQLRFMGSIEGFNYFAFRGAFCKMGGFKAKQVTGVKNEERLAKILQPYIFEAKKKDWGINIGKRYTTREYKLTKEMQSHFDTMFEEFVVFLDDGGTVAVDAAITKYIKLAQIQCGFVIDEHKNIIELVPPEKNPRLRSLLDFIDTELTGKIAIPYHHIYCGGLLSQALAKINPAHIKGEMLGTEIEAQKEKFNNDPDCRAILLQTRASKYGHTLLGHGEDEHRCNTMFFFENTYSLDDRSQIEDRIHRRGQTAEYCGYVDSCGTLIDVSMAKALQDRNDMYNTIMEFVRSTRIGRSLQA